MRKLFLLAVLFCSCIVNAADDDAVALLNKAVAVMTSDMPLKIDFEYSTYDTEGEWMGDDKGCLVMADGGCYSVTMTPLSVWCNSEKQWCYMAQSNEIYISSPDSEEARYFSPLHLMQLYKRGYLCNVSENGGKFVITLESVLPVEFDKVIVTLNSKDMRMESLKLHDSLGSTVIKVKNYQRQCTLSEEQFRCPINKFPKAEVIDLMN